MQRHVLVIVALLLAAIAVQPEYTYARDPFTLDAVRERVIRDYGGVAQLSTQAFADHMARGTDFLLLDVREADEFAVSRLGGAERVDPGIWRWSFMNRFADRVRGKTVIFYCSVGVRSSRLAEQVQSALKERGAKAVYNLDGGIFAWHNEGRTLVNTKGETQFVHPFDEYWGRLVKRADLLRKSAQ